MGSALAASAIYLASLLDGLNMTQARAAEAAGVTEVTVRNQSKRIRKILKVQPGRTPRRRRPSWHEPEASQSTLSGRGGFQHSPIERDHSP